jgi:O-antigen ligase
LAVAALVCTGAIAAFASAFAAVDSLAGDLTSRRNEGLIVLGALVIACLVAMLAERTIDRVMLARRVLEVAVVVGVLAVIVGAVFIVGRNPEPTPKEVTSRGANLPTNRARLATLKSNRYDYWKVALHGFGDKPLAGAGAHGFQALWLQRRDIRENAQDAHSLYIETLAELGVIGFAFLVAFLTGAFVSLRRALANPAFRVSAVGWAAALAAGFVHADVDWDWEMPAVFLILLALVGAAIAAAGEPVVDRDRG